MPSTCCIKQCGSRKNKNQPTLTMHRLPRFALKRKKWLDIIGEKNLPKNTESIFICSLHFDESCFNRTLNVTTLRDDAVPSRDLLPTKRTSTRNQKKLPDIETVITEAVKLAQSSLKTSATATKPDIKVQVQSKETSTPNGSICCECKATHPITLTPLVVVDIPPAPAIETISPVIVEEKPTLETKKETRLRNRCETLRKRYRALQEMMRRRNALINKLEGEKKELNEQHIRVVELLSGGDKTDHHFEDVLHKAVMKLS